MMNLAKLRSAALILPLMLLVAPPVRAADELRPEVTPSARPAWGEMLRLNDLPKSAADLKQAGQAFEQFGKSMEVFSASLAVMSSEFDPFGYKTAFRTISQQAETIERQQQIIQQLEEREILRLQAEVESLRPQPTQAKPRKRNKPKR